MLASFVTAGRLHSCLLTTTGAVRCWGANEVGQLGIGAPLNTTTYPVPQQLPTITSGATAIASSVDHTCAIVSGAARCWGDNSSGQLGNGSTTNSGSPVAVTGLSSGVTRVSAGYSHSCAIVNGAVRCWGQGTSGQLGNAMRTNSSTPVAVSGLTSGATAVAAGREHSCAVVNGAAFCWGDNSYGELGNNTNQGSDVPVTPMGLTSGVTDIAAGDYHTCAIVSGSAKCWGRNGEGQLGNMMGGTLVESIIPQQVVGLTSGVSFIGASYSYSCAVHSGVAKCWGTNFDYELGNGMGAGFSSNVAVTVSNLGAVSVAWPGAGHACARLTTGGVRCWGTGDSGELGDGQSTSSNVPVVVTGFQ